MHCSRLERYTFLQLCTLHSMHNVDFIIVGIYLIVMFVIGLLMKGKAGQSITSYFVADRSLPGWWVGLSILATTFAADTPLAVTGLTAKGGVQANWFWWSWVIGYIVVAIVMAKRWRRAKVLTDVEFIELRYEGRLLRLSGHLKALFLGVLLNGFILGWVITAMTKIAHPFVQWSALSPPLFELFSHWPYWLLINDLNTTITVIIVLFIVMVYSAAGGITRGYSYRSLSVCPCYGNGYTLCLLCRRLCRWTRCDA